VVNRGVLSMEYQQRTRRFDADSQPGPVTRLNGSGLYRRAAIDEAGYVTDRNLHGSEELDLAARLQTRGWTLARLDCLAIDHYCRDANAYLDLLRRIWTKNAFGPGEIIRASVGKPHFRFLVRNDRNFMISGLVAAWWCCIAALALLAKGIDAMIAIAVAGALPFLIMFMRWRSMRDAVYSVTAWNVFALCFLPGFLRPRTSPAKWMDSTVVKDPPIGSESTLRAVSQSES
jgi:hypothetical protein